MEKYPSFVATAPRTASSMRAWSGEIQIATDVNVHAFRIVEDAAR